MAKIKGKKGATPEHFDEFLRIRESLSEQDYTDYWRGVNKLKHDSDTEAEFTAEWNAYNDQWLLEHFGGAEPEPEPIPPPPPEPKPEPGVVLPKPPHVRRIVRASKGWAMRDAKKFGGRVVRVDRNGKRNRRGRHWKAVKK